MFYGRPLDFGQSLEVRIDCVEADCTRIRSMGGGPPYINYTVAEIRVHRAVNILSGQVYGWLTNNSNDNTQREGTGETIDKKYESGD